MNSRNAMTPRTEIGYRLTIGRPNSHTPPESHELSVNSCVDGQRSIQTLLIRISQWREQPGPDNGHHHCSGPPERHGPDWPEHASHDAALKFSQLVRRPDE